MQVTADAGEDVEKEEHSSIAGGTASWYNHSGNQFGGLKTFSMLEGQTHSQETVRVLLL